MIYVINPSRREINRSYYGRKNNMHNTNRASMFVTELRLCIDFLKKEIEQTFTPSARDYKNWENFSKNILDRIEHYQHLASNYILGNRLQFEEDLEQTKIEILQLQKFQLQLG